MHHKIADKCQIVEVRYEHSYQKRTPLCGVFFFWYLCWVEQMKCGAEERRRRRLDGAEP